MLTCWSPAQNPLVKIYLVAYNALSTVGWGYVLALLIIHLFDLDGKSTTYAVGSQTKAAGFFARLLPFFHSGPGGAKSAVHASLPPPLAPIYERATTAYARLGKTTTIVQSFAILEVVHALLGWVRSPVTTTAMQVASRLFLVWGITENFPSVRPYFLYIPPTLPIMLIGAYQPHLCVNGFRLVVHRSHPIHLLRSEPGRLEPLPLALAALHHLLCPLPAWRWVRSLLDLGNPSCTCRLLGSFGICSCGPFRHLVAR